jgi:glycosyltransferase involved in cell wall biosynthesis
LKSKNLVFTGCSSNLVSRGNVAGRWKTVYNAIDFSKYTLVEKVADDAPLMFLGRIERVKGCHTAIKVALETGNKLLIGGNISPLEDERKYFEEEIRPLIDGTQIVFLGALNDEEKNTYLGQSKALLFPIEWDEPFGMVMVEAMACGTPVIAFRKGSVQEVISHGRTGFVLDNYEQMKKSIFSIEKLDRKEIRLVSERKYRVQLLALEYLNLFS